MTPAVLLHLMATKTLPC